MAAIYVVAFVPTSARPASEVAIAPYLDGANDVGVYTFSAPLVPIAGPADAAPTHYGCCSRIEGSGALAAALASLKAGIPGSDYRTVTPWKSFSNATDWIGWLNGLGLKPRVVPLPA